jgi:hypothetical protein
MDVRWEIRSSDGGMNGLEFALATLAQTPVLLAHALPDKVDVTVRGDDETVVAKAQGLEAQAQTPMARLTLADGEVRREDLWPGEAEIGLPVVLAGGEVGILRSWWHADDRSAWRWTLELSNQV